MHLYQPIRIAMIFMMLGNA
nr:unnamed protein product [Callosobruchus chinensis]CAH7719455.1 unnamed protein product [Callosobruchus chinensis]CAH7730944.1 unnamed protein product [Callosobruchus chinensis]CAH7735382.1 unnamed protein product [Callosobruchus chinensis]CAH7737485.1 unnamed protein product [Callosobruchus chinensis]